LNIELLVSDLQRDEGWSGYLYDDATGQKIVPGSIVKGHPTVGYGFALDVAPLTMSEAKPILSRRAKAAWDYLLAAIPWASDLSEPRQRALANMAYQLGTAGLLKFTDFLVLLEKGQYGAAADDLATTPWFKQSGDRAKRIQSLIRSG